MKVLDVHHDENFTAYNADCVEGVGQLPGSSVGFSIYSPPFSHLFIYSDSERDMGNAVDDAEFMEHYGFLLCELHRATKPGRLTAVHCTDMPRTKATHKEGGLWDMPGEIIRAHKDDRFTEDLHSDGTQANQIGGLQMAIPTVVNAGVYGGISRVDNPIWRTASYDANSAFVGITQVNATTIKSIFDQIMIARSRGTKGPNVIVSSAEHYLAYTAATVAIQRINDENELGKLGFTNLKYYGAGKSVDVVLEGGIGSAMPSNVSYFIDTSALRFRYHPDRNFVKFGGKQAPINQDAIVQHIGFYGNLTLNNPLHMAKLYDSNPSA